MNQTFACLAAFVLFAPSCLLFGAGLTLSGSLEEVTSGAISIKLSDGRRVNAKLAKTGQISAAAIAARYHLADQVEATLKSTKPYYDTQEGCWLFPKLVQLRFLRSAFPEELSSFLTPRPWRSTDNLLKSAAGPSVARPPDAADSESPLDRARRVNIEYTSKLPNFVVDETAERSILAKGSAKWRTVDTIESDLAFQGTYTTRQHVRVNGKPWNKPLLPGPNWVTGFGELKPLFDSACPVVFESAGREEVRGKPALEYRFSSPQDGCFTYWGDGRGYEYNAARTGRVLIDETTGCALRFEEEMIEFPAQSALQVKETVAWDNVEIGGASHLLPVAYELALTRAGAVFRVAVEYRNHRRFEAASNVTFR